MQEIRMSEGKTQLNDFSLLFSYFSLTFALNGFLLHPTQKIENQQNKRYISLSRHALSSAPVSERPR